jgi:long-chain fatty acid transport protein
MGRAGAWVARASDPIALARNPAGLAGQPARMSAGWDLAFRHSGSEPFPVGFLAITLPVSPRLALGTGVVTPHGVPRLSSPLLESQTLFAIPTLGLAYEIVPDVRLGVALGWGMASVRTSSPFATTYGEYRVTTLTQDLFVPRATAGAHARVHEWIDVGASLMVSAPYSGSGQARASATTFVDHRWYPKTELEFAVPAEATVGVRLRAPRGSAAKGDPIDTEVGDLEIDAAWSNDSAIDRHGRRFRNVVGVRIGGDLNVVPGAFAIRAGAFLTPRASEPGAVALEAMGATRVGFSGGATARIDKRFDLSVAYLHMFLSEDDGLDVMHLGVAYRF